MRALPPVGISGWSWLNALGAHSYVEGDAVGDYLLSRSGLSPQLLDIPGTWGRVTAPILPLPKELKRHHSRSAQLLLTALEPLRTTIDAARARYGAERVAIVLGSSTGGIDATERALAEERRTGRMPDDFLFQHAHVYHALIRLLREVLQLDGIGFVISTACSSSGKALGAAQRLLATGKADAVLSGGVDALCEMTVRGFAGLGILAPDGCKPFDRQRNGISIGEGAALLLLERECAGSQSLLGVGESSDAFHATAPHPEGLGARLAMERALALSGLSPADIGYVNAHGTGTEQNDGAEARALFDVFGPSIRFSSTKDRVGHQLGTAGATEALFCLHALQQRKIPENRIPNETDPRLTVQPWVEAAPLSLPVAQSNSFAFGGSNVSVIVGNTPIESHAPIPATNRSRLFVAGMSLWGSGVNDLDAWLGDRTDESIERPRADILPARARGRASLLTRIYAELFEQLRGPEPRFDESEIALVFGSAYGEMETTLLLLDQLGVDRTLSPARFQGSVHNTAAGLLSILTANRGFSTALAAGDNTFAMSLVEAAGWLTLHGGQALVLVADERGPERMLRGEGFPALGVGVRLIASEQAPDDALCELGFPEPAAPSLEPRARASHNAAPAAWGLELIERLARGNYGTATIGPRWRVHLRDAR